MYYSKIRVNVKKAQYCQKITHFRHYLNLFLKYLYPICFITFQNMHTTF